MGATTTIAVGADGAEVTGYLSGTGAAGVLVLQEWWGLTPHIVDVTERFAAAGFTALAPDLYHGAVASDAAEAAGLAGGLDPVAALAEASAAVDLLIELTGNRRIGVVGYCMGGSLTLLLAAARPDVVVAAAPYYGMVPWHGVAADWSGLQAKVVGEYAGLDDHIDPAAVAALQAELRDLGRDVTMHVHPGAQHAFFNDSRPEVYAAEPALEAWERTLTLLREELLPHE